MGRVGKGQAGCKRGEPVPLNPQNPQKGREREGGRGWRGRGTGRQGNRDGGQTEGETGRETEREREGVCEAKHTHTHTPGKERSRACAGTGRGSTALRHHSTADLRSPPPQTHCEPHYLCVEPCGKACPPTPPVYTHTHTLTETFTCACTPLHMHMLAHTHIPHKHTLLKMQAPAHTTFI